MRRPVIAGNWKMYKTISESVEFVKELRASFAKVDHCEVVVAPPFTALRAVADVLRGSNITLAGQDCHWDKEGAHTGDISAGMLRDAGCTHVIVGHSERRRDHAETDDEVNKKLKAALAAELVPIVCVGETFEDRESGNTQKVLERQFKGGFRGLTAREISRIILAYEPVWAIGTGRTATPEMAAESHQLLRGFVDRQFGDEAAFQLRILYGGSVKSDNIGGLMAQEEIDGALVGGASLQADSFSAMVNYPRA